MNILSLTSKQLNHAADLKEKIAALEKQITQLAGGGGNGVPPPFAFHKRAKRKMSAAGRARIAAAQRARWAKVKGAKPKVAKRKMSAAAKARLAAAARRRWAKAKAAGKNSL
jgi:hypothetical protein